MKEYPVLWIVNGLKLPNEKLSNICICGHTKQVAFLSDRQKILLERTNIQIEKGKCPYSKECYDIKCKYNKTTPETFVKIDNPPQEVGKKFINKWDMVLEVIKRINNELDPFEELKTFNESDIIHPPEPIIKTNNW